MEHAERRKQCAGAVAAVACESPLHVAQPIGSGSVRNFVFEPVVVTSPSSQLFAAYSNGPLAPRTHARLLVLLSGNPIHVRIAHCGNLTDAFFDIYIHVGDSIRGHKR